MSCIVCDVTKDVMKKISSDPSNKTIKELEDEIRQNSERYGGDSAARRLLADLAKISGAIQRGVDYGAEGQDGAVPEGKDGSAEGVQKKAGQVQIIPTKEVKEEGMVMSETPGRYKAGKNQNVILMRIDSVPCSTGPGYQPMMRNSKSSRTNVYWLSKCRQGKSGQG